MNEHTPGPWKSIIDTSGNVVIRTKANDKNICLVDEDEFITDEGRADARLIAAAPDLLVALELWLEEDNDESRQMGHASSAQPWFIQHSVVFRKAARAAISKARGMEEDAH